MSDLLRYVLSQQEFRRARLPSLFSDFTAQRQTNPNGYTVNVQSWEEVLCKASKAGLITGQDGSIRRLSLEIGSELLQRLESKEWGRPLALNAVINEAVAQGRMVSSRAFMSSPNSIYSRSWAHSPWRLVSWGLEQIGLRHQVITTDMWTPRDFVLVRNVEEVADSMITYFQKRSSQVDRILSRAVFGREVAAVLGLTNELSNSDVTILLKYLARDKQVLAYDKDVIRLGAPGEVPAPISKQDREIASLKSLMDDLNEQIRSLETRIAALRERSQKAVELKNRASALTALRSKRAAETVLARRTDTLFQLEEIYGKIDQASDQITMLRVMKGSTEVLRNLNAKVGGTQDVEDVLDSLKDEMGQVEDVGMAISQAGQETNAAAEVEVDEELDALMRENHRIAEQEAAEETKRRLDSIQTVGKADDSTANQAKDGRQTTAMQIPGPSLTEEVRTIERMSLDQGASGTPSGISDVSWNSLSREKDANATLEMS